MINMKRRSKRPAASSGKAKTPNSIGVSSGKQAAGKDAPMVSESVTAGSSFNNSQLGSVNLEIDMDPLMEGMTYETSDSHLFNVYRDMYYHDPVCGSTVDMFSTLPFSEFSLGGADDKYLVPYMETIERLNLKTACPAMAVDQLVTGAFCGSIIHNKEEREFVDLMVHRQDNIETKPLPFFSQDPILTLTVRQDIKDALSHPGPRMDALRKRLGDKLVKQFQEGQIELDPLSTIYLPRRSFTFGEGTSYYKRVLPLWLIEKNLYRGTLVESGKRQRGVMHIQLGDGEQWEPSVEELQQVTDLFMSADADPLGAVVATRLGVQVDEFRQGGDFWKITDIWDQTTQFKMRALGISDAFLSGEASYANSESALTVFVESMKAFRDNFTRGIFYDKVFPLVAMMNGYAFNPKNNKILRKDLMNGNIEDLLHRRNDSSRLFIPTIHWAKQLKPEADQMYMEMLRGLQEQGVPVPIRALAAAGGFNLDQLLRDKEENLATLTQVLEYQKRRDEIKAQYKPAEGGDDGGGGFGSFASAAEGNTSAVMAGRGRVPLLDRDFGEQQEIVGRTRTGKKKYIHNQKAANEKANEAIFKAMTSISQNQHTPLTRRTATPKKATAHERKALRRFLR